MWIAYLVSSLLLWGQCSGNVTEVEWLNGYMPSALYNFTPESKTNPNCTNQGLLYRSHLRNLTLWAVTMMDASVIAPYGILGGSTVMVGAFDQCIRVKVPEANLVGQYCQPTMTFGLAGRPKIANSTVYKEPHLFDPVWKKLQVCLLGVHYGSSYSEDPGGLYSISFMAVDQCATDHLLLFHTKRTEDPRIKPRDTIRWAMCVPSACTPKDIEESLQSQLIPVLHKNGWEANISVHDNYCITAHNEPQSSKPLVIYLSVMGSLLGVVAIVSVYHTYAYTAEKRKSIDHWIFAFSVVYNLNRIQKPEGPAELQFMSGMKVLSMFLIIFGHRYLGSLYGLISNPESYEETYTQFSQIFILNGFIIVTTFFLISGFFAYNKILKDIKKGRSINVPLYIIYRWFRVSSVYVVIIFFVAVVVPYTFEGPSWKTEGWIRTEACASNWWTHILYISNYYTVSENECLVPSWYLSADMQLFAVNVLVGFIVSKWRKLEIPILSVLTITSIILPMIVVYVNNYGAIVKFYLTNIPGYFKREDFINTYTKAHMRASPYFIGMITAKMYNHFSETKFKFTKFQAFVGTVVSACFAVGSLISAYPFFLPGQNYSQIVNSVYNSLHRVTWAVAFAWIIIAQLTTGLGALAAMLGHRVWIPLSRLSLCALIVHPVIQLHFMLKTRQPLYMDTITTVWAGAGDIVLGYFGALLLYLVVEAPLANLWNRLIKLMLPKKDK